MYIMTVRPTGGRPYDRLTAARDDYPIAGRRLS